MATIDLGKIKQVWRGTYNNSTAYAVDDLVEYTDGAITSSYICTTASTGNAPSSGGTAHGSWAYVAKGAAGSPTTTRGDIIYRGASADQRLAKGTAGHFLKQGTNDPEWAEAGGVVKDWKYMTSTTGYSRTNNSSWAHFPDYNLVYTPQSTDNFLICTITCMIEIQYPNNTGGAAGALAVKVSEDNGSNYDWHWPSFIANTHGNAPNSLRSAKTCTATFVWDVATTQAHHFHWYGVTNTYGNTTAWFGRASAQPADDGQTNFQILEVGPQQS